MEVIRRLVEAYNSGGIGAATTLGLFDDAAVFEEPPEQPGPRVAEGRDALSRTFSQFDEAWEEHRSDPEEIRVIDGERVLLLSIDHFRGRDGIFFFFFFFLAFWERRNAIEAAGLQP